MRDIGEFELIRAVTARFRRGLDVLVGPGDDAAVLAAADGRVVVTTDLLLEGRHFRRDWSSGEDVGHKAAAQNLADVAAMGARPTGLFLGLAAPGETELAWALALADGLAAECARAGTTVAGGDVSSADTIMLGVTALGDLGGRPPVLRSGARPGDTVVLAGSVGPSAAGLALLASGDYPLSGSDSPVPSPPTPLRTSPLRVPSGATEPAALPRGGAGSSGDHPGHDRNAAVHRDAGPEPVARGDVEAEEVAMRGWDRLVAAHRRPRPPYQLGPTLAALGARAMCDISDGLVQDIGHIAAASGVRIDLRAAALPIDEAMRSAAVHLGVDPLDWALTGGEDHALVACLPPSAPLPPGCLRIGSVLPGTGVTVGGHPLLRAGGWNHFGNPDPSPPRRPV
ncbi:thiamine-monophosphate kinase [Frankia sp. AiPa1]|uniref:thiamine-monophosphate kinase n=1 Tax=Frankia sp. AiPa1 TaxID=573492 RepID=UPI00202AD380|nr:thiamine-monophosphate kinase [Frankia sp. AiPa1]